VTITQAGIDAEINTNILSGGDITAATLRQVLHDMNAATFQSGATGIATPTGKVGLIAAAGTLSTVIASDATLALDQTIAPQWTGQHQFQNLTASTSPSTGAVVITGGLGVGAQAWIGSPLTLGLNGGTAGVLTLQALTSGTFTNSIESVWAVLKRGIYGVYHQVSAKHLARYVDEFAFRLNQGNVGRHSLERLDSFVDAVAGKRITYKQVTA